MPQLVLPKSVQHKKKSTGSSASGAAFVTSISCLYLRFGGEVPVGTGGLGPVFQELCVTFNCDSKIMGEFY